MPGNPEALDLPASPVASPVIQRCFYPGVSSLEKECISRKATLVRKSNLALFLGPGIPAVVLTVSTLQLPSDSWEFSLSLSVSLSSLSFSQMAYTLSVRLPVFFFSSWAYCQQCGYDLSGTFTMSHTYANGCVYSNRHHNRIPLVRSQATKTALSTKNARLWSWQRGKFIARATPGLFQTSQGCFLAEPWWFGSLRLLHSLCRKKRYS